MDAQTDNRQQQSDASLMLAYANGEAAAFDTLYFRHKDKLYRYLHRQLNAASCVDELFQDVWARVINARTRYRDNATFSTWLYSIAHNRLVDHYRSNTRWGALVEPLEEADELIAETGSDPYNTAINTELAQRLKQLIGDLPPPQREAFLLREEAGLSLLEIASVTDVDRETVKSRLRYAVNKLRQQLTVTNG